MLLIQQSIIQLFAGYTLIKEVDMIATQSNLLKEPPNRISSIGY
jgi:hypothetical protein